MIDNATGGRFILGLGAGWHEGEHEAFGIPLPPMPERFARYESAVATIAALFSEAARVRAWEDGAWVRDAATAHAEKCATRKVKEAA